MLNALLDAWAARLEPLMSQFAQLPGAMVERGPAHPTAPDKRRQQKVESLICEYPFLAKDQGYIAFLWLYSGAYAVSCHDDVSVQIFGPIEGFDTDPVDREEFFCFASSEFWLQGEMEDRCVVGFFFPVSQNVQWGVYRGIYPKGTQTATRSWYCTDFIRLLPRLIESRGQLID
jgi:hypothetical protein